MCYIHSPVILNCLQITTMSNKRKILYKYLLIVFLETHNKISVHIQYSFFFKLFLIHSWLNPQTQNPWN